jgi:hypothetical protein
MGFGPPSVFDAGQGWGPGQKRPFLERGDIA